MLNIARMDNEEISEACKPIMAKLHKHMAKYVGNLRRSSKLEIPQHVLLLVTELEAEHIRELVLRFSLQIEKTIETDKVDNQHVRRSTRIKKNNVIADPRLQNLLKIVGKVAQML